MASFQLKDPPICPLNLIATVIILPGMMTGTQETIQPPTTPTPREGALGFWTSAFPHSGEVMVLQWEWSWEGLVVGNPPTNNGALSPLLPCLSQFLCLTRTPGPGHLV